MSLSFSIVIFAFLSPIYQCVAIALCSGSLQKGPALWMGNYSHAGGVAANAASVCALV